MPNCSYNVAVVGASGLIGREVVNILGERGFPVGELRLLATGEDVGGVEEFDGSEFVIGQLSEESFEGIDIAIFVSGNETSRAFIDAALAAGSVVIDGSTHSREDDDIPLIVPEVNGDELRLALAQRGERGRLVVASPGASAVQLAVVLRPIQVAAGIARIVVSTYEAVSGAGQSGMDELWQQTLAIFRQEELVRKHFPHQIAFSCIPQVDGFGEHGSTHEEKRVVREVRRLLGAPDLRMNVTAVRVPTFVGYGQSVNVETIHPLSPEATRELLAESMGIVIADDPARSAYPVGIEVGGTDATYVGRIRRDESIENGLNLWVMADNIRKGGALNLVEIAEIVIQAPRFSN